MKNMKKILVLALAALLLVAVSVAGTVAYLTATTTPVTNTFKPSTLSVSIDETLPADKTAQMIPGATIDKNPKVSYTTDVPAYVFVKVTESIGADLNFSDYIEYSVITTGDNAWKELSDGVYYMSVEKGSNPPDGISVIQDANKVTDKVTVKSDLKLADMTAIQNKDDDTDTTKYPKLTFQAYIIQMANGEADFTPEQAWNQLNPPPTTP